MTASTRAWSLRLRVRQGPACMGWQPFWLNKVIRLTRRHTTMELWRPVFGALHACEQGGQDQATLHEHLHVVGWWLCYGARRAGLLGLGETGPYCCCHCYPSLTAAAAAAAAFLETTCMALDHSDRAPSYPCKEPPPPLVFPTGVMCRSWRHREAEAGVLAKTKETLMHCFFLFCFV